MDRNGSQAGDPAPAWSKRRKHSVDWRRRGARRWAELRAQLEAELGRSPSPAEGALLDAATDVALAAEVVRARLTAGRASVDEVVRSGSELRRLRRALGLDAASSDDPRAEAEARLEAFRKAESA